MFDRSLLGACLVVLVLGALPCVAEPAVKPVTLEDLAVVALAPSERAAVLRMPGGELRLVEVGQVLAEVPLTVRGVTTERLFVELPPKAGQSAPRSAWLDRAVGGKTSRVTMIERERPADQATQPVFVSAAPSRSPGDPSPSDTRRESSSLLLRPAARPPR